MEIVEHIIVGDEISYYEDLHMVVDMDLHLYVVVEMIKDVLVIVDMVDIDIATNMEFDVVDMFEDLHDTMDLCVPNFPEL